MTDFPHLLHDIRTRIDALEMPREQIAPELDVTYSWLCKFMQGKTSNPRVLTVSKVLKGLARLEGKAY